MMVGRLWCVASEFVMSSPMCVTHDSSITVGGVTVTADSTTTVTDGQWHHVVGYRSGNCQGKVYVDGVLEKTTSVTPGADVSIDVNTPLYIGRNASGGDWYAGCVDDVRFYYDTVMSDTLIRTLAQGHEADWTLDRIGNWTTYTEDAVVQNRTHNLSNELTQINGSSSHLQHDAAGNMTYVPKVGAETSAHWTVTSSPSPSPRRRGSWRRVRMPRVSSPA